ncbi:hypothetical protein Acr_02g0006520 [Actinidia rufa]|uniref:Uncharacterized protein n=1 Tax=Actinidia rufa TaxID=165716 RepID=A0A7J0E7Y7_9ERIC|nr:hypothetical protein Acr_02g0006520 [Actinidia rufa]
MDQILNKVGSYWIGQKANKEMSSVGDDINLMARWRLARLTSSSSCSPEPHVVRRDGCGEVKTLGRGEHHGRGGQNPRKSEFNELISSDKVSAMCLRLQDNLVELLDIVFQALPIFLVDCEEVGGILLPDLIAHEIVTKSLLRSPKESMVLGDNFLNHDLTEPFKWTYLGTCELGHPGEVTFPVSWLNVPNQHYGDFVNPGRLIGENGDIDQHLLEQHLMVEALKIRSLVGVRHRMSSVIHRAAST